MEDRVYGHRSVILIPRYVESLHEWAAVALWPLEQVVSASVARARVAILVSATLPADHYLPIHDVVLLWPGEGQTDASLAPLGHEEGPVASAQRRGEAVRRHERVHRDGVLHLEWVCDLLGGVFSSGK